MSINPSLTNLSIEKANIGFYQGFNRAVTIGSKTLIGALILWAAVFSEQAGALLSQFNGFLLANFGYWYMYVVTFYVVVCFILALWPRTDSIHLGQHNEKPEFSRFS